jgi:Ca2+-binding RTX toxin-like protein
VLNGGAGNDTIDGGQGADTLIGGAGADVFSFTTTLGAGNVDTITNFQVGVDKILLGGAAGEPFAALASGFLSDLYLVNGSMALAPYDVLIYNPDTGALLYDADGNGAGAAVQFAALAPDLYLSWTDFQVSGPSNGAPAITSGESAFAPENIPAGTIVYQAAASDPDGDRIVWWLDSSPDASLLTIDQNGTVRLLQAANYETQSVYNFTVVASDSGVWTSKAVQLTIDNLPEPTPAIAEKSEPNDEISGSQVIERTALATETNSNLPNDDLPSVTISGSISSPSDRDYFGIYLEAGEVIYLDIDNTSGNLDAYLELFRVNGGEVLMTSNDDLVALDPGSEAHPEYGHNTDSLIRTRVLESGYYYFAVSAFQDPERPTSGSYELHVSVGPPATAAELLEEDVLALISGLQWDHTNLTYGFPTSATQYPAGMEEIDEPGEFSPLTAAQQTALTGQFATISAVSGLTFTAAVNAGQADLRYAMSSDPETAHAHYPTNLGPSDAGGTVWFNKTDYLSPTPGNYAWVTFLHETGHALGLKHGHETPAISYGHDSLEYSVMTYRSYVGADVGPDGGFTNETWGYPQTLMMLDIAALQRMYGANFATNAGNTVYRWSPTTGEMSVNGVGQGAPGANRILMTVWDGGGTDTYDLSNYATGVTIDLRPGGWTTTSSIQTANLGDGHSARGNIANALLFQGDPRSLIENATGGSAEDILYGNDIANNLNGGAGNDHIEGWGGDDTLIGGEGFDSLRGGDGNDVLTGEALDGENGNDILNGSASADTLHGGAGADTLNGGGDWDDLYGEADGDTIYGGDGYDRLYGGDGADVLNGDAGNDILWGEAGDDVMAGGLGNDDYRMEESGDQVIELDGEGYDRVYTTVSYTISTGVEFARLLGDSAANLNGNSADNELMGNSAANVLTGGGGADTMYGYGGNDTFYVDHPDDLAYELTDGGTDIVYTSVSYALRESIPPPPDYDPYAGASINYWPGGPNQIETLALLGSSNLSATGNGSANTLLGNAGANVLDGKGGIDILRGYAGADTFAFTTALGPDNIDTIADYSVADDVIHIDNAVFAGLAAGALAAGAFRVGSAAADADDRIIYNSASGALLFDADGNGAGAAVQFAVLSTGLAMAASKFLVI